ncbi:MAG: helix-turn-helix transcriptional regulator [Bacteroidales bacterium]|nr:helix-turn-helix transcriptional regulator [Bacteroidales bacterium]
MKVRTKHSSVIASILSEVDELSQRKSDNRMLLAHKIYVAMKNMNLTQKKLAEKMSKSESEVSDWLSGDRNFTIELLTEIEMALNVKLIDTTITSVMPISSGMLHYNNTNKTIARGSYTGGIDCASKDIFLSSNQKHIA